MCSRTSCASCASCSSERPCRSCGPSMLLEQAHEVRRVDEVGDLLELGRRALRSGSARLAQPPRRVRCARRLGERLARRPVGLRRQLPGSIDSELAHVCALAVTLIAASRLSERIVGAGHVEDVVDDLEQHAQLGGETAERDCRRSIRRSLPTVVRTAPTRRSDGPSSARAGAAAVRRPGRRVGADVGVLPAHHPVHAGRRRQLGGRRAAPARAPSAGA